MKSRSQVRWRRPPLDLKPGEHYSSVLLCHALTDAGCPDLAERARRDEWNDYFSAQHDAPAGALVAELEARARRSSRLTRHALRDLVRDVKRGHFDATKEEADLWAASEEGILALRQLAGGA